MKTPLVSVIFGSRHPDGTCLSRFIPRSAETPVHMGYIFGCIQIGITYSFSFPVQFTVFISSLLTKTKYQHIWQKSLSHGQFPRDLKLTDVIPFTRAETCLWKGGSQGTASNYKPVALTSQSVGKIVKKFIMAFLEGSRWKTILAATYQLASC